MEKEDVKIESLPLFEAKQAKGRISYKLFASTVLVSTSFLLYYRFSNIPGTTPEQGRRRWLWIGMFLSEFMFFIHWILNQSVRWNIPHLIPLKDRILSRFGDNLPEVDIFVCTADPEMEPPIMVVNTVLSVMSYNYPTEKLSVYLSDDGGSEFTFYALLEASEFSKKWLPFCRKFSVEPRAPEAYFDGKKAVVAREWMDMKKLYDDMKKRIDSAMEKGRISEEIRNQNQGFMEWNHDVTKKNHQPIVKIAIDGREKESVDSDGIRLPTLVYIAREKRPDVPHNFKAGAMNALIRVSSEISNGGIILNVDCDMYANDADAIAEALCFFADEREGNQIAFVQHPQKFANIINNDIYGNYNVVVNKVELPGLGGYGTGMYNGTCCFHRRASLSGEKYSKEKTISWGVKMGKEEKRSVHELEERSKVLASCSIEHGTQWGKEMGLIYGCPVEDIVTGLTIQCRGWRSVFYEPEKEAFLGVAPTTLDIALVQFKRWSEGMFQIFLSKYCPFILGHNKIKLGSQMGHSIYLLWAPLAFPTLYYAIVPPLCLLSGIPLFPKVSSLWFIPFAYVFLSRNIYNMMEHVLLGGSLKAWWNLQRMVMFRRTTSFLLAFIDTIVRTLGLSQTTFALTAKVVTEDVSMRYEQGIMEFGSSSIMFTIIATLAMLNLMALVGAGIKLMVNMNYFKEMEGLVSQVGLCGLMVILNGPVYDALFLRKDKGSLPFSDRKSVV